MMPRAPSPALCSSPMMSSYEPTDLNVLLVPTPWAMCCFHSGLDIASPGTRSTACASFASPDSCLSTACTQLWQLFLKPTGDVGVRAGGGLGQPVERVGLG